MTTPNDLPSVGTEDAMRIAQALNNRQDAYDDGADMLRALVSERDELASRVRELEGVLNLMCRSRGSCNPIPAPEHYEAAYAALASKEHP